MIKKLSSPTLSELRTFLPAYFTLFGFSFFSPFLYLAAPIYGDQIVNRVLLSRSEGTLWVLAGITTFLVGMYSVLDLVRTKALYRLGIAFDARLTRKAFEALHRGKAASQVGPSVAPLSDINIVREFLSGPSIGAIFDAIWSPIFVVVMFLIHPVYGYFALTMIALTSGLSLANQWLVKGDSKRHQLIAIKASEFGAAVFHNAETVRVLGMIPVLRDRWYGLHQAMLGWQAAASRRADVIAGIIKFVRNGQMVFVYTIGALLYLQGQIGQATMFVALIIMVRGLGPIDYVISNWSRFTNFAASLDRLDELLRPNGEQKSKVSLPAPDGPLVVSRLFGTAPGSDRLIINDVSFTLAKGRVLGIVGPSGAGKSCLARLLAGIWKPKRGSIAIGDNELVHWDEDELGKHLGYMPQDVDLLPGTIAENIARFDPGVLINSEKLIAASEIAGIQDLIKGLPDGYNTRVGAGGHVLSGGQRQRIALARAVYDVPRLVILDEPNSNLDAVGEQALGAAVQRLRASGTTVVVVTHKVSLLAYCDDVLVLSSGTVQAFGNREQIVNRVPKLKAAPALTLIEGALEGRRQ